MFSCGKIDVLIPNIQIRKVFFIKHLLKKRVKTVLVKKI
ncbi:hypothetical protein SCB49_13095 [unidentified eubacterium SCB49]|nr:hypothetical protein SCB49_13095 [unidentified eubacterium SCB49]